MSEAKTVYEKVHLLKTQDVEEENWGDISGLATLLIVCEDKYEDEFIVVCRDIPFRATWNKKEAGYKKHPAMKVELEIDVVGILYQYNPTLTYTSHWIEGICFVKRTFRNKHFSRKHGIPKWMVPLMFALLVPSFGFSSIMLYKPDNWIDSPINMIAHRWLVIPAVAGPCDVSKCTITQKPTTFYVADYNIQRRYVYTAQGGYYDATVTPIWKPVKRVKKNPENKHRHHPLLATIPVYLDAERTRQFKKEYKEEVPIVRFYPDEDIYKNDIASMYDFSLLNCLLHLNEEQRAQYRRENISAQNPFTYIEGPYHRLDINALLDKINKAAEKQKQKQEKKEKKNNAYPPQNNEIIDNNTTTTTNTNTNNYNNNNFNNNEFNSNNNTNNNSNINHNTTNNNTNDPHSPQPPALSPRKSIKYRALSIMKLNEEQQRQFREMFGQDYPADNNNTNKNQAPNNLNNNNAQPQWQVGSFRNNKEEQASPKERFHIGKKEQQ